MDMTSDIARAQGTADDAKHDINEHLIACGAATAKMQAEIAALRQDVATLKSLVVWCAAGLVTGLFGIVGVLIWAIFHIKGIV